MTGMKSMRGEISGVYDRRDKVRTLIETFQQGLETKRGRDWRK